MVLSEVDLERLRQWAKDDASYHELVAYVAATNADQLDFDVLPIPVVIVDAVADDHPITYVNAAFEDMTGYTASEAQGQNPRFLQNSDRDQPVLRQIKNAIDNEQSITATVRNYTKAGELFHNRMQIRPLAAADGNITQLISTHQDVTIEVEQQSIAEVVEQTSAYFIENAHDMVAIHALDGSVIYLNPAYEKILGYDRETLRQMALSDLVHPEDWGMTDETLQQKDTHINLPTEYRIQHQDGHYIWVESHSTPIYNEQGQLIYFIAITHNITERKYRSEQEFRTLIENNPDMIQRLDREGRFLYANQALAREFGLSQETIIGKTNAELGIPPNLLAELDAAREYVYETGLKHEIKFRFGGATIAARLIPEFNLSGNVETILVIARDISTRIDTERALRESETRLRRAQYIGVIGSWERNLDTGEIFWSDTFYAICGLDPTTTKPSRALRISLTHPDDRETAIAITEEAIANNRSFNFEKRIVWSDGTIRWVQSRGSVTFDEHTGHRKATGTIQDITERKQMELALAHSEAQAKALINAYPDLVFRLDRNGTYLEFFGDNRRLMNNGYDLIGRTVHERLGEEIGDLIVEAIHLTLQTGTIKRIEHEQIVDGENRIYESRFVQNGLDDVIVLVRDVTAERSQERAIQRREQQYDSVLATMVEGVLLYDQMGQIVLCNDAAVHITGYARDILLSPQAADLILQTVDELQQPYTIETFPPLITLRTGEPQSQVLIGFENPQLAEMRWIKTNTRPLVDDESGRNYGVVMTFYDFTKERRHEEDRLNAAVERERIKILNSFIQMTSHEFRTPLSVIMTNLHLMLRIQDPDKQQERAHRIQDQVNRLNHLVEMQLSLTKLDTGMAMDFHTSQMGLVISQLIITNDKRISDAQLSLDTEIIPHDLTVTADSELLKQALQHLLDNAIAFTPQGGHIVIRATVDGNMLAIQVVDNGVGIEQDDMPFIFDRFWRRDKSHTKAGFGLGLPIARQIIALHNGHIDVDSDVDEGTTVTVYLPRAIDASA